MNKFHKLLTVSAAAVCVMMLSLNTFAAVSSSDVYYCNGYAHNNGRCTGHAYGAHHSATYVAPSTNVAPYTGGTSSVNYGSISANNSAATVVPMTPVASSSYYGGHHGGCGRYGGHGYYR